MFEKGKSGNPNGRPRGSLNKTTLNISQVKKEIESKSPLFIQMLWANIEKGESWAFKLWAEMIPKKVLEDTVTIVTTPETQLADLTNSLTTFEELTQTEVLHQLKVVGNIKVTEDITTEDDNLIGKLTDEQVETINAWVKENKPKPLVEENDKN